MSRKNLFLLLSVVFAMLIVGACTPYQYSPYEEVSPEEAEEIESGNEITGDVVLPGETEEEEIVQEGNETLSDEGEESPGEENLTGIDEQEEPVEEDATEEEVSDEDVTETEEDMQELEASADIVAYEGDLIDLKPYVMDPDGDPITLGYTLPFDEEGIWQTEEGDAGYYSVIITATDNKDASFVTKQMTVNVLIKNKPPVIDFPDVLVFQEGDMIILEPEVTDPDGDVVFVTYSGWIGKTYQTTYDDAGQYTVTIRADDKRSSVFKDVTIIVEEVNRLPVLSFGEVDIDAVEGGLVKIDASVEDPDGEGVDLSFSEPFDENGEWQTAKGDAGTYVVNVTATDGINTVTEQVTVDIARKNELPVINSISVDPQNVVLKSPGDQVTIKINVDAYDPDGDELEITYSGYMESDEMTVEYGMPGGEKTVTVTVSDGKDSVSGDVSFTMNNWPCFDCAN